MKKTALIFLFLLSLVFYAAARDLPELTGRVVDQAGLLQGDHKSGLESLLANYEKATGNQLVIALVRSLDGEDIEGYSIALAEKWKIGTKKEDNGIIILIAPAERRMRIEVGYGLEGTVTDADCHRIIETVMKPNFRKGDFYNGLKGSVESIATLTGNLETLYQDTGVEPYRQPKTQKNDFNTSVIIFIIFLVIFIIQMIFRGLGGGRSYSVGSGRRHSSSYWGGFGGSSGGFGGGGFSGGGFSGGGGGFGGGGSSGSW